MRDILIVEDGLHERERLQRIFEVEKFSVCCAESVQDAEKLLEVDDFRLVLLDIGLGDKSGSVLFERLRRASQTPYIIVLTGNPSTHLKQRFLEQGAHSYIVKASQEASNDSLLELVTSMLGQADTPRLSSIALDDFLRQYVPEASRELFLDEQNNFPSCRRCASTNYHVTFAHKAQVPPIIEGRVVCVDCGSEMDPEVG